MGVRYSYPRNRFAALRWGCPRGQLKPMGVGAAAPPPRPALPAADVGARQLHGYWRRGRDSNPRYGYPYAAFRVRCFQPLSHLSVAAEGANILSVGGYVSNARRLNKNGLSPGRVIVAFDRWDTAEDLSDASRTIARPRSRRASR